MESSSDMPAVDIDVVADVVCPWCYIGKRRLEKSIALTPGVNVRINWRPYFLIRGFRAKASTGGLILKPNSARSSATRRLPNASRQPPPWKASSIIPTRSAASQTRSTAIVSFCGRAASPIPAWSSTG
jgi:hypothetical protein